MKSYEFQAKSVEKAIEKGLDELGKTKFDVDIKILESGGLFKKAKVEISFEEEDDEFSAKNLTKAVFEQPKQEEKVEKKEQVQQVVEEKEEVVTEKQPEQEVVLEQANETVQQEAVKERIYSCNQGSKQFLEGLLKVMNIDGTVEIDEQEEMTKATISTEQAGVLIGYRGESLSNIQYIANIVEQKQNRYAKRLIVDVAGYRERRDDNLKDLADKMARKALKEKKSIKLKPMNAYERRIIHSYLQKFENITTHSVGQEPNRCLVIDLKRD